MKISEYIKELERVMANVGDVDVQTDDSWGRNEAPQPTVAYVRILTGRQHKPRFWGAYDPENTKGATVCRV